MTDRDDPSAIQPTETPAVTPRDLHPTSDIRFVMIELAKVGTKVDRLIEDVRDQGVKIDDLRRKFSWFAGASATAAALVTIIWGVVTLIPWSRVTIGPAPSASAPSPPTTPSK